MPPFADEHTVQDHTGFTSNLLDTIQLSKARMIDWAEGEKAKIDDEAAAYRKKLDYEQGCIDSLATNLLGVQFERGLNTRPEDDEGNDQEQNENLANRKVALEKQQAKLESDLSKLKSEYSVREKRVQEITLEQSKQRLRAQDARSLKERVQEAKQTTVDDLTRGIVNYKYLGLDFEKTDGDNELRFFYSQMDPEDPARQFSFVLQVDDLDRYEVCNCEPSLDASVILEVTKNLNDTDDMSYLVRRMRHAFLDIITMSC